MAQLVSDVTEILDYKDAKKTARTQRQQILEQMARDRTTQENLVKKALATQRAKYGAGGVSSTDKTSGAVLSRIKTETAEPYEEKRRNNLEKLRSTRVKKPNLLKSLLSRFDALVGA